MDTIDSSASEPASAADFEAGGAPGPLGPGRKATLLGIALALLFALPSLRTGFFLDDYHQIGLIEGWHGIEGPGLNLYDSFLEFPGLPWWYSEQANTGFWRPLSSAPMWIDHALFGRWAVGWHLHTLLWLAALMAVAARLYGWLPRRVAVLSLVILALEEAHGMTTGILCNRHTLLTSVPAFLGLLFYLRWRRDGWRPGRWAAPSTFVLALFFGETTIAVMSYALAWELGASRDPWPHRVRAIAPLAALALGYVAIYGALGLGPKDTNIYLNPFESPTDFGLGMVQRIPALLAGGLVGFPSSLWMTGPQAQVALIAVGSVASLLLALFLWRTWPSLPDERRRSLAFWLVGTLGSVPPVAAAMPSERQLLVPAVGLSVVIALVLDQLWFGSPSKRTSWSGPVLRRLAAGLLLLVHLPGAGFARVQIQNGSTMLTDRLQVVIDELEELAAERPNRSAPARFIVANAPDFFLTIYPPVMWTYARGEDESQWCVLSMAPTATTLRRTSATTLEMEVEDGHLLGSFHERVMRSAPEAETLGGRLRTECMGIEITETVHPAGDDRPRSPAGLPLEAELPRRVRFDFAAGTGSGHLGADSPNADSPGAGHLDNGEWLLITWKDGRFRTVPMPAVGETRRIEPEPGLLAIL